MTKKENPFTYAGSGTHWRRHLKVHGREVHTIIVKEFENEIDCSEFSIKFSRDNNIVKSKNWANLVEETGTYTTKGYLGKTHSAETKTKISNISKQNWKTPDYLEKMENRNRWTEDARKEQSERLKGVKRPEHSIKMRGRNNLPNDHYFYNKTKTESHKISISIALTDNPKRRICRLHDKKEISVNAFTRWIKSI